MATIKGVTSFEYNGDELEVSEGAFPAIARNDRIEIGGRLYGVCQITHTLQVGQGNLYTRWATVVKLCKIKGDAS